MKGIDLSGTLYFESVIPPVAAADATVEFPIAYGSTAKGLNASGIIIVPSAAVTGNDTNTKYLNIINYTAAASGTELGHYDLATGSNLSAGIAVYIPIAAATLAEDGMLTLQVEKVGSGVALPPLRVLVAYTNQSQTHATQGSVGAAT